MTRRDGREDTALRTLVITPHWLRHAPGSALITMGETRVLCAVSVEERVPPHIKDTGRGWVTGEYAMLPASGQERTAREVVRGRPSGRTMEIQRLIGRALRSVVDAAALGPRTLWVDCDVLQADGGTRTASITGAYVALAFALAKLRERSLVRAPVLRGLIAAVSVGIVEGRPMLDLDYAEDSSAEVDMNVVRTDDGRYVEVQGTAESEPFPRERLDQMLALADVGIDALHRAQREAIGEALPRVLAR
ncbi:MAG TPA: ribonuclease PH [Candidatus Polarisedimenticolaceae bacterium]|nr:ribonuclease PH [Candidatus Polarisedimenticolaceae bacterium]